MQELLLLVLPLLNMMSIRSILMFPFSNDQSSAASLPEGTCPVCEAYPITTPFMAIPCGHLYCYFCLRTRTLADANFRCRRCSTNVVALKRFQEQVGAQCHCTMASEISVFTAFTSASVLKLSFPGLSIGLVANYIL